MVDAGCFDSHQRLMQAFVDQEPHALLRRLGSRGCRRSSQFS
jgi:hypothetical protein